jgi:hypothetical protein
MKRLAFIAVFLSLLAAVALRSPVAAQFNGCPAGFCSPQVTGAGGYTGPGDLSLGTATAFFGLRAYSAATRGTKVINLCDTSGANCADVLTNATTGVLNAPGTRGAVNCTTSGTCLIKIIYDQIGTNCSGVCDMNQTTTANMPVLSNSCGALSKTFCIAFVRANADQFVQTASFASALSQPFTVSLVAVRTGTLTTAQGIAAPFGASSNRQFVFNSGTTVGIYGGSGFVNSGTVSNSAWHSLQGVWNDPSNSVVNVDGSNGTPGSGGTNNMTGPGVVGTDSFGSFLDGNVVEYSIWSSAFSSGNSTTMCHNQFTYWGTSTSC